MKKLKLFFAILIISQLLSSPITSQAKLPANATVVIDGIHGSHHYLSDKLKNNLITAGSSVIYMDIPNTSYSSYNNLPDGFFAPTGASFLIPNPDSVFSSSDLKIANDWWASTSNRLIWVAGDSEKYNDEDGLIDQEHTHNYTNNNALLKQLGSKLRIGSESVEDPVNNDGADYRVMATGPLTDGLVNNYINEGVTRIFMHGPAPIVALDGETVVNPAETKLSGIEVIMMSSTFATVKDYDSSNTELDFYNTLGPGPVPLVVIEEVSENHWVIVSGESVFTDFQNMYGSQTDNSAAHDGQTFVDNILSWYSFESSNVALYDASDESTSSTGSTSSSEDDSPINLATFVASFVAIVIIKRKISSL